MKIIHVVSVVIVFISVLPTTPKISAGEVFTLKIKEAVGGDSLKNRQNKILSGLSSKQFLAGGNSNWSKLVSSDNAIGLKLSVGSMKFQDCIIAIKDELVGFSDSENGIQYKVAYDKIDFGSIGGSNGCVRFCILGKNSSGDFPDNWWEAENAFMVEFSNSWVGLSMKNSGKSKSHKANTRLWSSNYKGSITSVAVLLSKSHYVLAINGITSQWNSKGSISGEITDLNYSSFDNIRVSFELKQNSKPNKPFICSLQSFTIED